MLSVKVSHYLKKYCYRNNLFSGPNRKLVIKNASFESEGSYECRLPLTTTTSRLSISEREIEIITKLSNQKIPLEGDAVFETVLNCLNAEPVWKKDGTVLKNGPRVRLDEKEHPQGGLYRCTLMKQIVDDAGDISFVVTGNQCRQQVSMEVMDLPLGFSKNLTDQETKEFTASVTFECNTTRKGAHATWYVNGRPIEEGSKYTVIKKNFNRKLIINNLTGKDNYEVKCRVTDNGDSAETSCRLVTSKKTNQLRIMKQLVSGLNEQTRPHSHVVVVELDKNGKVLFDNIFRNSLLSVLA